MASQNATTSWASLPCELRLNILESITRQKPPGWASLASVCKEWQPVFEKENYKKLKIRSSRLGEFESMVPPQKRHLIHHIWLDIELRRYSTRCCTKRYSQLKTMGTTVTKAIRRIFSILSNWETENSLTLELNVVCPTDSEHWFRNLHFSSDCVDDGEESERFREADCHHHDPRHGWLHGAQVETPSRSAMYQLLYPIRLDESKIDSSVPTVKAITQLVIRRQLRRRLLSFCWIELLQTLPCLENIVYEPWYSKARWTGLDDEYLSWIIQLNLPKTVQRIAMFQESTELYDALPPFAGQRQDLGHHDRYDEAFATKSLELHHLAVSFMVDAERMFQNCEPDWVWPNLQTLSLTSPLLQSDDENRKAIEDLLCRAGELVRKMPKMRTLVLWNGGKEHACAFIYRLDGNDDPSITWRGTWDMKMSPRVIESWQVVASTFPSGRLDVRNELIREAIGSHGDAIYHLRLPVQVVEPASLWQMRREARGM
ncbi:hypothetical protein TGAM01_v207310 [Trichoderma gamsii]|uniref:DUF6546 domain-containing protein n=1 Tax=Trichoderma gamsii TaxID=398673 RepID=A0A2P4ZH99_9HYPO|nr:hypothetical protein TGAM01_v207310 [Trichoderma gamsii]PON23663.1 hypothetical protein TGAM01_v207310 [Trichoderma gamsii]